MEVLELEVTVIQADGLAAKDTNILGFKTSSDPYCEVRFHPRGQESRYEEDHVFLGKTVPVMKTLKPKWDQSFQTFVPLHEMSEEAQVTLTLMDWDKIGEDDLMGVVTVYIPMREIKRIQDFSQTKWYGIPASSAEGEEATGRVQVTLKSLRKRMTEQEFQDAQAGIVKAGEPQEGGTLLPFNPVALAREEIGDATEAITTRLGNVGRMIRGSTEEDPKEKEEREMQNRLKSAMRKQKGEPDPEPEQEEEQPARPSTAFSRLGAPFALLRQNTKSDDDRSKSPTATRMGPELPPEQPEPEESSQSHSDHHDEDDDDDDEGPSPRQSTAGRPIRSRDARRQRARRISSHSEDDDGDDDEEDDHGGETREARRQKARRQRSRDEHDSEHRPRPGRDGGNRKPRPRKDGEPSRRPRNHDGPPKKTNSGEGKRRTSRPGGGGRDGGGRGRGDGKPRRRSDRPEAEEGGDQRHKPKANRTRSDGEAAKKGRRRKEEGGGGGGDGGERRRRPEGERRKERPKKSAGDDDAGTKQSATGSALTKLAASGNDPPKKQTATGAALSKLSTQF